MARKFTWEAVTKLEVGQSCFVSAPVSEVKRKCALYGGRKGKRFIVTRGPDDERGAVAVVRRDTDPAPAP